jgi:hypothetical protein
LAIIKVRAQRRRESLLRRLGVKERVGMIGRAHDADGAQLSQPVERSDRWHGLAARLSLIPLPEPCAEVLFRSVGRRQLIRN